MFPFYADLATQSRERGKTFKVNFLTLKPCKNPVFGMQASVFSKISCDCNLCRFCNLTLWSWALPLRPFVALPWLHGERKSWPLSLPFPEAASVALQLASHRGGLGGALAEDVRWGQGRSRACISPNLQFVSCAVPGSSSASSVLHLRTPRAAAVPGLPWFPKAPGLQQLLSALGALQSGVGYSLLLLLNLGCLASLSSPVLCCDQCPALESSL